MRYLIIETATERGVVGIFDSEKALFLKELPFGYQSSTYLLPALEKGFKEAGCRPKDLAFIAAGNGPGSYTGMRMGAMVAKTFAFACKLPLIPLCSLAGFAPRKEGAEDFAVLVDAKVAGVYMLKGGNPMAPQTVPLADLSKALVGIQTLVTPNSSKIKAKADALFPENEWQWEENAPKIERLAQIAQMKYEQFEGGGGEDFDLIYTPY